MDGKITDAFLENYGIKCVGTGNYENICIGGYRFYLEIDIKNVNNHNDKGDFACIMINPSTTFPDAKWNNQNWKKELNIESSKRTRGFDPTVRNVIRLAHLKKYTKVKIFNLFPYIQPNSEIAFENLVDKQTENLEIIEKHLKGISKLLIAWGSKTPKNKDLKDAYIKLKCQYLQFFQDNKISPVAYAWNEKKKQPYHPSQQVDNSLTKDDKTKIIRRKIKNAKEKGVIQQFIENEEDFIPLRIEKGVTSSDFSLKMGDKKCQTP